MNTIKNTWSFLIVFTHGLLMHAISNIAQKLSCCICMSYKIRHLYYWGVKVFVLLQPPCVHALVLVWA